MTVRIAFLGDTLLGGVAQPTLDAEGYSYALRGIAPLLAGTDLVVTNQEGPITHSALPQAKLDTGKKRYWYCARPESVTALRDAGIRLVSLANNHTLDFGMPGLVDTIQHLDNAGVRHCGAGSTEAQARQPSVITVKGCRIGFISCLQRYDIYIREKLYATASQGGCYQFRPKALAEDLRGLAEQVDVRIVLAHWGRNYRSITARQRRLAAGLRAAGADLVVGHHPHVAQRVELASGTPILYSLGNGALGTPGRFHSGRPPYGLIAIITIDDAARMVQIELRLLAVDNSSVGFCPVVADDGAALAFLRSIVETDQGWQEYEGGLWADLPTGPLRGAADLST